MQRIAVLFAKGPTPGAVKTRLCPPLEPEQAASLAECFILDTASKVRSIPGVELVIACTPPESVGYFREAVPFASDYLIQQGEHLGARMASCVSKLYAPGRAVVLIGTDTPTLPVEHLTRAFTLLETREAELVIGPTSDGGYCLIGMTSPHPELFELPRWSTPDVLTETLRRAEQLGPRTSLLPEWYDIDTPEDLIGLFEELSYATGPCSSATEHTMASLQKLAREGMVNLRRDDRAGRKR